VAQQLQMLSILQSGIRCRPAHKDMQCWVHHDNILDDDQANQRLKEAWEHNDSKDELRVDFQGLEQHF
jgi:hypothetical protein